MKKETNQSLSIASIPIFLICGLLFMIRDSYDVKFGDFVKPKDGFYESCPGTLIDITHWSAGYDTCYIDSKSCKVYYIKCKDLEKLNKIQGEQYDRLDEKAN